MTNTRAILCGYHWAGCKALATLEEQFHEVFVYTHQSPDHVPDLAMLCRDRGIAYTIDTIEVDNLPFLPDVVCSIYYRHKISEDVISTVGGRLFNLHPSLLPKYRGCSSLTWAMINEDKAAGYSFHYIDAGTDTGNIIIQKAFPIESWDTQQTLYQRAMELAMLDFSAATRSVVNGKTEMDPISWTANRT